MAIPRLYWILIFMVALNSCERQEDSNRTFDSEKMMIRISEIEIVPEYLDEYLSILTEESKASVALEPGVISIYPMYQKENPTEIRILEIYADKKAYEDHLKTPHFKHYKTRTLKMVKSLKLVDMSAIDGQTMPMIFEKVN
ncbi:antibiotic biosynthesis monooxygenase [Pricia sp. S334]|uniref:Antibiotic biosynthesis monooxygenase n=1 Tax=Pricia mediterranea TaxID=3076079 RepID=A0ABU3L3X1_9FLAO|nr:antibiotic biosynthesis monooxygenase [Pricia sp. S334]MDT7828439.1 antibiotic biosynthesis monooxygenase [Pricia sp. S334]